MLKNILKGIYICLIAGVLVYCSSKNKSLVGKWIHVSTMGIKVNNSNQYIILNKDKTGIQSNIDSKKTELTWSIKDKELCLKFKNSFEMCGKYKLDKDKLSFTTFGVENIFKRDK